MPCRGQGNTPARVDRFSQLALNTRLVVDDAQGRGEFAEMLLASMGPRWPEALVIVAGIVAAIALIALVWLVAIVGAALFEAFGVAWLLARLLPRSFKERWLLRPWLLAVTHGVILGASVGASFSGLHADENPPWWPIVVAVPFVFLCGGLAIVEVVRLVRWAKARKAAVAAEAAKDAVQSTGKNVLKRMGARVLVSTGQAVSSAGVALIVFIAVVNGGPGSLFEVWGFTVFWVAVPPLLALLPWYLARRGGPLVPALEANSSAAPESGHNKL